MIFHRSGFLGPTVSEVEGNGSLHLPFSLLCLKRDWEVRRGTLDCVPWTRMHKNRFASPSLRVRTREVFCLTFINHLSLGLWCPLVLSPFPVRRILDFASSVRRELKGVMGRGCPLCLWSEDNHTPWQRDVPHESKTRYLSSSVLISESQDTRVLWPRHPGIV